ncbi:SDR family oxidoreductase [Pleurocapsales cyanobacterium LEGE 06147]|nr:SDR family oxidoreductase [Pleurocapsales cyanobacterium LEGE 06147]
MSPKNYPSFQNKHVIITGGSSGIGKATAKLLARQGANISIIARDVNKLKAARQEIETARASKEQKVFTASANASIRTEIKTVIEAAIDRLGTPDILITSVGIARPGYFGEIPIEVFEQSMAINYFGSLYSLKAVLPAMERQKKGCIVLISSGAGLIGIYGYSAYSPSKFALRGLAESIRGELQPKGIQISIVYPPNTDTPQLAEENKTKPTETKIIEGTAKTWMAEDVAQAIIEGINRKSFAITPGWEMNYLNRLHSLLSPILNWYFDRIVTRVSVRESKHLSKE